MSYFFCPWRIPAWLATLWMLLGPSSLSAGDQTDLLTLVRAGHRAARESVHTLSATVTIERTFPKHEVVITAKYWRSLNLVRIQQNPQGPGINDFLLKDSEIRQVGRSRQPNNARDFYSATRKPPTDFFCMSDAWREMLIDLPGPDGAQYDYDRFLEFAQQPPKLRKATLDGRECVRLTMHFDTATGVRTEVTLWHDIGYNYLIRKLEATYGNSESRGEAEILEFAESPPGVFLPIKCRRRTDHRGKQINGGVTTLTDVQVNAPISPDVFRLPAIPAGTMLHDWVQGTKYPVDGNWQPIGRAEPISKVTVAAPSEEYESEYRSQSTEEPRTFNRWLLLASLAVLVSAGGYWTYRRYRSRRPGHAEGV